MDSSSSWLDYMIDIDTPPTNQVRDRSWLQYLEKYENRNSKWLDNATINWAEEHISPIRYIPDQWDLQQSIKGTFSLEAHQSFRDFTTRVIHELYNSYINDRPATFDEEPEPASDAELKELLGIK